MTEENRQDDNTSIILDSIADGVFTVDSDWRITSFNKAAEEITGISREEAIGQRCCDVFHASICETNCALRETFDTGKPLMNRGVYIIDSDGDRVPISISTAVLKNSEGEVVGGVETFRDLSAIAELRRALDQKYSFQDIISKNDQMLKIFDTLPVISESDSTVLIEGESGTGKELVANAIHNLSHRKDAKLVTVNCGALPDTLLESELFGYKAGAFTDARKDRPGRFAVANGGTVFLDEIADISAALQVKLLRVLQERRYEPLGSTESVDADIRIIAASNKDLQKLVRSGKFREDLYYRINVIPIKLPPLRDRREDIPLLIRHFIRRFNNLKKKIIEDISPDALSVMMSYDYPGNVRELINIVEHAHVLGQGSMITVSDLPETVRPASITHPENTVSFDEIESAYLVEVLRRNGWNRRKTAAELGVHKTTLWRKMRKLGISPPTGE